MFSFTSSEAVPEADSVDNLNTNFSSTQLEIIYVQSTQVPQSVSEVDLIDVSNNGAEFPSITLSAHNIQVLPTTESAHNIQVLPRTVSEVDSV